MIRLVTVVGWVLIFVFALRAASLKSISADVRAFQLAYIAGFAGYLALIWVIYRVPGIPRRDRKEADETPADPVLDPGAWRWWLAGCIAVRVLLLGMEPSDDAYRYVWEGRVQLAGFNPYMTPPDDTQLAHLRDADFWRLNHPDYPAIYPPIAQLEFLAVASAARAFSAWRCPSVYLVKLLHTAWDVLVVVLLGACLRRSGRPPHGAIVYGLCPLVLSAFAIEGHLDSLMLLFTALAAWAIVTERMRLAGITLGLAIAAKLVFVVLLPWFVVRQRKAALVAVAVVAFAYLPYVAAGPALFRSLQRFSTGGQFFSFPGTLGITSFDAPVARGAAVVLLLIILSALAWRRGKWLDYARGATGALLLLMPIVHYWYLTWIMMILPFGLRARWVVAALAMVTYFEAPFSEATTGTWHMPKWAPLAVWVPFLLTWAIESVVVAPPLVGGASASRSSPTRGDATQDRRMP
ncbi:MAG: glycosyltransferase 87 family protein [Planctomycetota bacterium]